MTAARRRPLARLLLTLPLLPVWLIQPAFSQAFDDLDTYARIGDWTVKWVGDDVGCYASMQLARKKWAAIAPPTRRFRGLVSVQSISWERLVKDGASYGAQFYFDQERVYNVSMGGHVSGGLDREGEHQFITHAMSGATIANELLRSQNLIISVSGNTMATIRLQRIAEVFEAVKGCEENGGRR